MRPSSTAVLPGITVDCVVFGLDENDVNVLLVQRQGATPKAAWSLPGGGVQPKESLDEAARRELVAETGLRVRFLEQLYTFGATRRDPRRRTITVAYFAFVKRAERPIEPPHAKTQLGWFGLDELPALVLDHEQIIDVAVNRLRAKIRYQPIGFELLPPKFTLRQLQHLYETLLARPLDKRNFRKKILAMGVLVELDELEVGVAHRAARLYRFDRRRYQKLTRQGFNFEI